MRPAGAPDVEARAAFLFEEQASAVHRRTDRLFAFLMMFQYMGGILAAIVISPRAWEGTHSHVHVHVWGALLLGGLISALPVTLALTLPGRFVTRCVVAAGQMAFSALLIHLTGGRIETHFHVFGSLAFLAFYRDWRVLVPATLVVAADHLVRGIVWPQSVYGVLSASPWRTAEHAGWVIFEDVFLIRACVLGVREMREIARRRAELEAAHAAVEAKVAERTAELRAQRDALEAEVAERQRAQAEREAMQSRLMDASRRAGMADVATGVLHNVGNVLNSVNVSVSVLGEQLRRSRVANFARAAGLLRQHRDDLAAFVTRDEKGRLLPDYLIDLAEHLSAEQSGLVEEVKSLARNVEHIKSVVNLQQSYARVSGVTERAEVAELVEDALRLSAGGLDRHRIQIDRRLDPVPPLLVEKHKLLQILVNLIRNAKQAMSHPEVIERRLTLHTRVEGDVVRIDVVDTGVGIDPAHLDEIFAHGFTTREHGHGFGLHTAAVAAKAIGGSLTAHSEGPGRGARFSLSFPLQRAEVKS